MKRLNTERGFALGVTIVILALVVSIAVGLAVSRQMWGQIGEKQLHRILTQTALDVDTLSSTSQVRNLLLNTGGVTLSSDLTAFRPAAELGRTELSIDQDVLYQTSPTLALPDGYSSMTWRPELFFDELGGSFGAVSLAMWDPLRGIYSFSSGCGLLMKSELDGAVREGKSDREVSKLHAWMEVDTAKYSELIVRWIPASAMTVFFPRGHDSLAAGRTELPSDSEILQLGNWAGGAGTDAIGRYYVEGSVAPARPTVTLDVPLLVTRGLDWGGAWPTGGSWNLVLSPMGSTTGGTLTNPFSSTDRTTFLKGRFSTFQGLFATGEDRPVRLGRYGGGDSTVAVFRPHPAIGNSAIPLNSPNLLVRLWNRASVRVVRNSGVAGVTVVPESSLGMSAADITAFSACFTVDDINKEIRFAPSSFSFTWSSLIVYVTSGGVDNVSGLPLTDAEREAYSLRVILPDVDALGWVAPVDASAPKGLTIASDLPMILENGYNAAGTSVPTMLVSPKFFAYSATSVPVGIQGVLVTEGGHPEHSVYPVVGASPSQVNLYGSLILWGRNATQDAESAANALSTVIRPLSFYLSGQNFPPGVPSLMDVRVGREALKSYRIYSEDTVSPENPGS